MATYLTTVDIGGENPTAKQALVGDEAVHLGRLNEEGVLGAAILSTDAATAWLVLEAESEEEVEQIVSEFPLAPWFEITSIEAVMLLQPAPGS